MRHFGEIISDIFYMIHFPKEDYFLSKISSSILNKKYIKKSELFISENELTNKLPYLRKKLDSFNDCWNIKDEDRFDFAKLSIAKVLLFEPPHFRTYKIIEDISVVYYLDFLKK